jgi:hypothetical protein
MAENAKDILSGIRGSIRKAGIEQIRKEIKPLVEEILKSQKVIKTNEERIAAILRDADIEPGTDLNTIING